MKEKCCEECGKLRTEECDNPGYCVLHGYSKFASNPWKRCSCGGTFKRVRTDRPTEYIKNADLVCDQCGQKARDLRELQIIKTPA